MLELKAGAAYFVVVFAIGSGCGTLRTLVIAPHVGEVAAVLIELPAMLAASWLACAWVLNRFAVPARGRERLAIGAVAFLLLIAAEAALGVFALGRSLAAHVGTYRLTAVQVGLAAQLLFGLFPVIQPKSKRALT